MTIEVLATDSDLNIIGPMKGITALDVTAKFNEPGSGKVTVPLDLANSTLLAPGNRLVVKRNGEWFFGGPIERPGDHSWQLAGPSTLEVGFTDDLAQLARLVYPDPANDITAQTLDRREFSAVNAETAMRALVDESAAAGALTDRQVPALVLAAAASVGSNVTLGFRLEQLLDALRAIATAGGVLGFRIVQVGSTLEFQVYEPADLTASVAFSVANRNLLSYQYRPAAPRATVAIVGDGSGTGASRVFRERVSAEAANWGRMETLVDARGTTDVDELDAAGDVELASLAATASLSARCLDTPQLQVGVNCRLGDLVSVQLATGDVVADVLRAIQLEYTPKDGEFMTIHVGTQSASTNPQWLTMLRRLRRDVQRLQAI